MNADRVAGAEGMAALRDLSGARERILAEVRKVIVGQDQVIEELLVALFAGGHCLLVGVPGLAKTLLVRTLARVLDLEFSRIQFTPDLMPSDITGTEVLEEDRTTGQRAFRFVRGPVFANMILADEINRTPPKTQAALLEAMQEQQVTVGGQDLRAGRAVLRAGHAEPDRAGGHLPAARGAARPLHVQHRGRLPRRGRGDRDRQRTTTGATRPTVERVLTRRRDHRGCRRSCAACRWPTTSSRYAVRLARPTRPTRADAPASSATGSAGAPARARRSTWSWAPRRGRSCTGARRRPPRTSGGGPAGAAAPHRDQLQRRGRGRQARPDHRQLVDAGARRRGASEPRDAVGGQTGDAA